MQLSHTDLTIYMAAVLVWFKPPTGVISWQSEGWKFYSGSRSAIWPVPDSNSIRKIQSNSSHPSLSAALFLAKFVNTNCKSVSKHD